MAEGGIPRYACDICGQEGLTDEDMRSHILIEHVEGAVSCPFCDLEGTTIDEMNIHVNMEHLDFLTPTKESFIACAKMDIDEMTPVSDRSTDQPISSPESNCNGASTGSTSGTDDNPRMDSPLSPDPAPSIPSLPMEITITGPADSPKKTINGTSIALAGGGNGGGGGGGGNGGGGGGGGEKTRCCSPPDLEEQTRKRAKLYLDVPGPPNLYRNHNLCNKKVEGTQLQVNGRSGSEFKDECGNDTNDNTINSGDGKAGKRESLQCPLCEWQTTSPGEITRHVNSQHLDILSPNPAHTAQQQPLPQQQKDSQNNIIDHNKPSTSTTMLECPICGMKTPTGGSLELHVNTRHVDILSPGRPQASQVTSPMSVDSVSDCSQCCPVCGMEFSDTNDLAVHVDGHFSAEQTPVMEITDNLLAQELERRERAALKLQEQREFERLQELYGMTEKSSYKKQAERNLEKAVCNGQMSISDYYTRKMEIQQCSVGGVDDGHSCTRGIISRLKQYYKSSLNFTVSKVWLCTPSDHYAASYGDKGWGCGYRNLQMLLSALSNSTTYEQVLFNGRPLIPSIPKIQRLIEAAWQKGFDLQGCEQLGGKVVNTTKWIGATEIVATLSSLNIKCQLADFHAPTGKEGTHPRLFEWVRDYFSRDTDFKPPLYLQHQGHSRTIIGIEELKDGTMRLLLFDPSCSRKQMQQFLGDINANLMRSIRRTTHSMKAKQYQIVAVVGILTEQEYEEMKVMKSDRIP